MHYTSYVVIGGKSSVFRPKSLDRSSPGKQNGLLSRKGTVLHSPAEGRSPTRLHSGQCSPGPRDFLLLSAPSQHRRWLTVLTCQLSGVPEEAGWDAAPIQGQQENESVGPKKTVSSINTLRGPRHLSLLPQNTTSPSPWSRRGCPAELSTTRRPLQRPGFLFNMATSGISVSRAWKNGKSGGTRNHNSTISRLD